MGHSGLRGAALSLPSIVGVMARGINNNNRVHTDPLPSPYPRLRINTKLEERTKDGQSNKRGKSEAYPARDGRSRSSASILSPTLTRYESPVSNVCDGWCGYNVLAHRTAVSVVAFSCCAGEPTVRVSAVVVRVFRPATCLGRSSGFANDGVMQVSQ